MHLRILIWSLHCNMLFIHTSEKFGANFVYNIYLEKNFEIFFKVFFENFFQFFFSFFGNFFRNFFENPFSIFFWNFFRNFGMRNAILLLHHQECDLLTSSLSQTLGQNDVLSQVPSLNTHVTSNSLLYRFSETRVLIC